MAISKTVKYSALVLLALVLAGIGAGIYLWNKPHVKVENQEGITLTVDQLCRAYNKDEKAANMLYLNKAIQVSGRVSEIDRNLSGGSMVIIQTSDSASAVLCSMRGKNITFKKGEMVTLKGFCSGNSLTGVALTGCVPVR